MAKLLAFFFTLLLSSPALARDAYYLVVFGAEDPLHRPSTTHTWGTWVKATGPGEPDRRTHAIEAFTISWLPRSGKIRTLGPPEIGRNYSLDESFRFARNLSLRIASFGAREIKPELYEKAIRQKRFLDSGNVLYAILERAQRPYVVHCQHALADVDQTHGPLNVGIVAGIEASRRVLHHFRPWLVGNETHRWVEEALGVTRWPVERASWER